eukprot:3695523-Amphidinium_carterae.1
MRLIGWICDHFAWSAIGPDQFVDVSNVYRHAAVLLEKLGGAGSVEEVELCTVNEGQPTPVSSTSSYDVRSFVQPPKSVGAPEGRPSFDSQKAIVSNSDMLHTGSLSRAQAVSQIWSPFNLPPDCSHPCCIIWPMATLMVRIDLFESPLFLSYATPSTLNVKSLRAFNPQMSLNSESFTSLYCLATVRAQSPKTLRAHDPKALRALRPENHKTF